ncbi:hypothetical protein Tco_0223753 [Tanacetum coccineum]
MNVSVTSLFLLVLLEYPNGKGVVRTTSRGLDMALHWSGVGDAPLRSPSQDETSEPLLYAGWMAGSYRCKDATQVLKSVGCAKVVGVISWDVEESTWCCVEFTISHSMEARRSNGLIQDGV